MHKTLRLLLLAGMLAATGCAYTHIRAPFDLNVDNTELGSKTGYSSNYSVLWLVAWGDGSYKAAADNGGITNMKHADYQLTQYLAGLYVKQTTIVYGD